ncbi:MAG TPA: glycoside hydrolase family 16 protein [Rariglobus sp.]|nr:glycoside hydrolase family 16 protein [Rariglobus sp.]
MKTISWMTKFFALAALSCGVSLMAMEAAHPFVQDGSMRAYQLSWADEFDGASLDTTKWDYRTDSKMWSTQLPANVQVSGGVLKLVLKKEPAGDKTHTGAGVISKKLFQYGFYEARLRVPPGAGWHTSFWMMQYDGKGGTNPGVAHQELDVIEQDSVNPKHYAVNVHKWMGGHFSFGGKAVRAPDLSADFHVFGCEFTSSVVKYFFDGALVQTVDLTKVAKKDGTPVEFTPGDQNIWLTSIASSMGNTKEVDDSRLPAAAEFDYVRFFERKQ